MPILKKNFSERNPLRLGLVGVVLVALLVGVLLELTPILSIFTTTSYSALFPEAGGLVPESDVKINGVIVGAVTAVSLDGEQVRVDFVAGNVGRLGTATRAAIKTGTILGDKFLALQPAGPGRMPAGTVIPLDRTVPAYDLGNVLPTLTKKATALDSQRLAKALNTISVELAGTPAPLRATLDGVSRLSATIASRDVAVRDLLSRAQSVTGVLAARSNDIVGLVSDGSLLLRELNDRRDAIQQLLVRLTETFEQLKGLVKDNEHQLGPALDQLHGVLELLNRNDKNLAAAIHGLNTYAGSLGEAVGGGPWFFAYIQNLPPTNFVPGLPVGSGSGAAVAPAAPPVPLLGGGR